MALVLLPCLSAVAAAAGDVTNLQLASTKILAGSRMFAFPASEIANGHRDLNGDGDHDDSVMIVYDREQDAPLNLGLSAVGVSGSAPIVDGEILAFLVSELGEGADLNGDGDREDLVPHVFDRRDLSVVSLGRHSSLGFVASRRLVAFVEGGFAGPLFVYDTHRRELREIGFAGVRFYQAIGRRLVFALDGWVHVYDVAQDVTTATGLRVDNVVSEVAIGGSRVAIPVSETAMGGLDLNADGDALDRVAHLFDLSTGVAVNSGIALGDGFGARSIVPVKDRFLVWAGEREGGDRDLNGDGDAEDLVLHRMLADGSVANLSLVGPSGIRTLGSLAAWPLSEISQGADLNGDGDALDWVVHLYHATWDEVISTRLASGGSFALLPSLWNRGVGVAVGEAAHGGVDLNGDGDAEDQVPHLLELTDDGGPPSWSRITNTRLALGTTGFYVTRPGRFVVVSVSELGQAETDLNGDGELLSSVVHSFSVARGRTRNWRLDDSLSGPPAGSGGSAAVLAWEWLGDLNGDGDIADRVVHVGGVWPRELPR